MKARPQTQIPWRISCLTSFRSVCALLVVVAAMACTDDQGPRDGALTPLDGGASPVRDAAPPDAGEPIDAGALPGDAGQPEEDAGSSPDATEPQTLALNVMTFNIRWEIPGNDGDNGWPNRRAMVYGLLNDPELDVVGLQEATPEQIADIRAAVPAMAVHDTDPLMNGIAILYRTDRFTLTSSGAFWFSATPDVPDSRDWYNPMRRHVCAWVQLTDIATNIELVFYDLHLDVYEPSRDLSVILLGDRLAARGSTVATIVVGDFNAGEPEDASRYLRGEIGINDGNTERFMPSPVVDTFRVLHPNANDVGTSNGWVGNTSGRKVDYIYVAPGTAVLAADINHYNESGAYPSDHYPVTATIELRQ